MNSYIGVSRNFAGSSMGRVNHGGFRNGSAFSAGTRMPVGAMSMRVVGHQSQMAFSHYAPSGAIVAITTVLLWTFLFFGIVAFAKWIFGGRTSVPSQPQ